MNVLMLGTGEYTTGYVPSKTMESDKGAGVVALAMFDLRSRGKVSRVGMCGVNGNKFPAIRNHMDKQLREPYGMDTTCETWPADDAVDPLAYKTAVSTYKKGDVAIIFTPDDSHFEIAKCCIEQGMHVIVTKPIVKTLAEHKELSRLAHEKGVLVSVEVHKRWDPFYRDARDRIRNDLKNTIGRDFQYMYAYMSQPKGQLDSFRGWAGKSSDISYYLNSHHVDFSEWCLEGRARPTRVTAMGSTGVALSKGIQAEDTITLTVHWENLASGNVGTAIYSASWAAPTSDVHSQQRFMYMGSSGEIKCDQAHRGYNVSTDANGYASANPLFMKYEPRDGKFAGQSAYGFQSFEIFVDAAIACNDGTPPAKFDDGSLATVHTTMKGTAILEAGRLSLDHDGQPFDIKYSDDGETPIALVAHQFK